MNLRTLLLFAALFTSACGGVDDSLDDAGTGGGGGTSATGGGGGSTSTGGGGGSSSTGGGGGSASTGGGGGSTCTDTWSAYGASFFSSACASCHHHSGQYGTQASVQAALSSIKSEISTGKMPEGTTLSATDKARILAYLTCGAP